jgi:hypothetical protein
MGSTSNLQRTAFTVNRKFTVSENPFRDLTDQIAVPLEQIAAAVGRTNQTVRAYRAGVRTPPPEVYARLADFIDQHQTRLPAVARLCRQLAKP